MTLRTGRILRRVGLLMEAIGLVGFVSASRMGVGAGGDRESYLHPASLSAIVVCVGFFVWALGTALMHRARVVLKKRVRPLDL